ncbi:MAG: TetR/AcrR family transcriptional regulator [Pseudomonadota bacterium]
MPKKSKQHPKERIKEAAISLFSEKGYSATTMRQIARRAGLASGSLYNHLKRKSDLLLDIHRDFVDEIIEKTKFLHGDEESCEEKLREVFKTFMKAIFENKLSFKVLLEQETFLPPTAKKEVVRNVHLLKQGIKGIIEKGIKKGEIRAVDAKMATFCVFALCNYSLRWIDPKGSYSYEQLGDIFFDFFSRGIGNVPPRIS